MKVNIVNHVIQIVKNVYIYLQIVLDVIIKVNSNIYMMDNVLNNVP